MKKILSVLMTLIMAVGVTPIAGFALSVDETAIAYNENTGRQNYVYSSITDKRNDSVSNVKYTYDSSGRLIKLYENDGWVKITTSFSYDEKGNMTKKVYEEKSSGYSLREATSCSYYDDFNLKKRVFTSEDSNGENKSETSVFSYNSKGLLSKQTVTEKRSGDVISTVTTAFSYDTKGNNTGKTIKSTDGDTYIRNNTYSESGQLLKSVSTYSYGSGGSSVSRLIYDSSGNLTEESYENNYGDLVSVEKTVRKYDKNNNLLNYESSYGENGENPLTISTITCSYDTAGNMKKQVYTIYSEKEITDSYVSTYKYDSSNRLTKETTNSKNNSNVKTVSYDSHGNVTKKTDTTNHLNGEISSETDTYTYNAGGKVIKHINTVSEGEGFEWKNITTRSYDSHGNTVKVTESEPGSDYRAETVYTYEKAKLGYYMTEDFTCVYPDSVIYTGEKLCPTITIDGLYKGVDYTLSYTNNIKTGTGRIKVHFLGDDYEDISLNFKIIPAKVTGLKASSVKTDRMNISWSKAKGAKYYKLEMSSDGKTWKTLTTTSKTSFSVSGLKAAKKYQFRVTSLDETKKLQSKVSGVLKTGTATSAPSIKLTSSKSKAVMASWNKVTGASRYAVYKSSDGKNWVKVGETAKTSYTLTKLTGGRKIYVRVRALNAYGTGSVFSTAKSVTVRK